MADAKPDPGPVDEALVRALAAALDLEIPEACLPGVIANFELLRAHAARIEADAEDAA